MAKAGDRVKVLTKDEEIDGILMPRPGILEKGITVVKMDTGYNIGIEDKKIKEVKVLEAYKSKAEKAPKLKNNPKLPIVAILSTGGTISSKVDYKTGGTVADYTAEDFVAMMPELAEIANIKAKKITSVMSEDMDASHWKQIAEGIAKELKDVDGIVVTHGTDTLHFTTAAASFMLTDFSKPVIFTAAQRSIDRGSSDSFMNLICAVTAAAKFDGAGVFTCLHGTNNDDYCILNRGTKVRKMHTSRRDAFRPVNELPIAEIHMDGKIKILNKNYNKRNKNEVLADTKFEDKTALIHVYPGMDSNIIDFHVKEGYKGIVIAGTGLGHMPTYLFDSVEKAVKKGVVVAIAPQPIYGRTNAFVYSNARMLSIKLNCIFVEDMLPETAYVKLGFVLAHEKNPEKIKELMQTNIAGEINLRHQQDSFLY